MEANVSVSFEEAQNWLQNKTIEKCQTGTIGKPLFKRDDIVGVVIRPTDSEDFIFCTGTVYIVDDYGTFEQNEEPSYDVMLQNYNSTGEACLVKHVRESGIYKINL